MRWPDPELTELAWQDLDALFDAVLESSGSSVVASRAYEGVLAAVESAAAMPEAYPSVAARTEIPCDYRWVAHKGWLAFYHVRDDGGILVDRVLWGRAEWARALGIAGER